VRVCFSAPDSRIIALPLSSLDNPGSNALCCTFRYVFVPGVVIPVPTRYFGNWPTKVFPKE